MRIHVGTSGWSYKEWKGSFYPADLPADGMLRYYATRLASVEINNSFYRIPKESVLLVWAELVPPEFRFVLKASRRTWRAALEFRHASWFTDEVYDALREHDVALVAVEEAEGEGAGAPLVPTASWGYLRLRRTDYDADALRAWLERIRIQPWREAYAFLKHDEDMPTGPETAVKLAELAGVA